MKTRIGIAGYGNLGRGVEFAVAQNPDTELVAVFTRRNPETVKIQTEGVKVYPIAEAASHKDEIDVLILCGGSATDLPVQTPELCKDTSTLSTALIPTQEFRSISPMWTRPAKKDGTVGIISVGWDPGTVLPEPYVRRVHSSEGQDLYLLGQGRQPGPFRCDPPGSRSKGRRHPVHRFRYRNAVEEVRALQESGADHPTRNTPESASLWLRKAQIFRKLRKRSRPCPTISADYDTTVHFISEEEFDRDHSSNASRRFRDPHRKDRQGREHRSAHRVFLKAWFQPGIYLQRSGGLRKSRSSHGFRGTDRLQDRFRCGSVLPFPVKRRGASRPSLIRSAKKDPFLDKRGSFFLPWNRVR